MRWVTYATDIGDRVGVIGGDRIHPLAPGVRLVELIGRGAEELRAAGEAALASAEPTVPLAGARLRAPVPRPPSVRDCLCFLDHMRNCQQATGSPRTLNDAWYRVPAFYFACPSTVVGPYDEVTISPGSAWFDFELEVAAVIGPGGRDLTPERAEEHIIGYTIYNDWSARDLQMREAPLAIGQAKGKDGATTLGPFLVTPDELAPHRRDGRLALRVEAKVNGTTIGSGDTGAMDWSFGEVISYASRGVDLVPGDVFGSGTVPGCCLVEHLSLSDPAAFPGWLRDGDVVELTVEGLGHTRQTVRASAAPYPLAPRHDPDRRPPRPRVNRAPSKLPYTRGLHEVGPDVWAWLLPDGGYGWSNAGLVAGEDASLLVDTLFDLRLTAEMLDAMRPVTGRRPITRAVITHANGDHTHGNQLLDERVQIIAAEATCAEMRHEMPPEMLTATQVVDIGPATPYFRERFGAFDFSGIRLRLPDLTFDGELTLDVGGREVRVMNLGPAHTAADSVVHVPDAGVLFAGDLLFVGCTPIVWSGPISHWIAACDRMIATGADTIVPGHGPVTDPDGIRAVRGYLTHVVEQADAAHARGLPFGEAVKAVDLGEYAAWLDAERIVVNLHRRYRELDPATAPELDQMTLMTMMAERALS
ncbi:fumarylacetoacetate hydrolase family protein [Actinomadura kijaniata]|uniref:2-keto-4-pentenoate hydratase/2-oxohepta-3-ene-1,7-dioic acid hydratase in catechol pathway/glyoxylase-like metal-dependent hydrolase (Beta-lactamase superfamily II) n=1 Tax=Actinomadura namibiensis TaxID=182080 RepID=A0A7W3LXR1_ACTNM|nr:fumarylacetoacetate hydrolase family protein [Actinomadura namibiensis]MBA8956169.1 2-keto-4-pentenoate hydratase/2-oxohepta-3-ene-1,7-dioic acid hydratase in catechol pathway/glyoxylase-like metal-dependent hydrolase (beta-lactamase superfamily II) [Actinomadura namibiensis]